MQAFKAANLDWEDVFVGPSLTSLRGAVAAGLGVMAITRNRADDAGIMLWDDAPLPKLPDLYSGIYVREGGARPIYEQLADEIAEAIFSPGAAQANRIGSIESGRKKNSAA